MTYSLGTYDPKKDLRNSDTPLGRILRTPKLDFTELKRIADEFEQAMTIEHEKDRKIIAEALREANNKKQKGTSLKELHSVFGSMTHEEAEEIRNNKITFSERFL